MVKDPVCGMMIDPKDAYATREHAGQIFYLCSKECTDKFDADPHRYGHLEGHEHHNHENKPSA